MGCIPLAMHTWKRLKERKMHLEDPHIESTLSEARFENASLKATIIVQADISCKLGPTLRSLD